MTIQKELTVRVTTLLNKLLRLPGLRVKSLVFEDPTLIIRIGRTFRLLTCPICGVRVRGRHSQTTRRWRHLAIWGRSVFLEGTIRRLRCPKCEKVVTEDVPWARHDSHFTRPFEDTVGALAQRLSHTAVAEMIRIAWATVGAIASRLVDEHLDPGRFANLRRIGVDEISYRRHHRYITVVIDHDTGRVVWAGEGKSSEVLGLFFDQLTTEQLRAIELISMDMSAAFIKAATERIPGAKIAFDKFHLVRLAIKALETVRRDTMRLLGSKDRRSLKNTRWALLRSEENRSETDEITLEEIRKTHGPVFRAHGLKEAFCELLRCKDVAHLEEQMKAWLSWASRCRLKPFVTMGRTIRKYFKGVLTAVETGLTNARLEGMNNKIRLISHRAYGFHSSQALIAMIYLCCTKIDLDLLQLV